MRFPKILLAAALVVAGVAVPLSLPPLAAPPHGVVGMGHEGYEVYGIDGADVRPRWARANSPSGT